MAEHGEMTKLRRSPIALPAGRTVEEFERQIIVQETGYCGCGSG